MSSFQIDNRHCSLDFCFLGFGYHSEINVGDMISFYDTLAENAKFKFFWHHYADVTVILFELQKLLYTHLIYDQDHSINCETLANLGSHYFDKLQAKIGNWTMHDIVDTPCQNKYHFYVAYSDNKTTNYFCIHYQLDRCKLCSKAANCRCERCQHAVCHACLSILTDNSDWDLVDETGDCQKADTSTAGSFCKQCGGA